MEGRKNPSGSGKTSTPTHPTKQQELEGGRGRGGNSSEANGRGFRVTGVDGTHYKGERVFQGRGGGGCCPGQRTRRAGHGQNQLTWAGKGVSLASKGNTAPKRKEAWLSDKATPNSRVAATPTRQKIMGRETQPSHTTTLRAEVR